MCDGAEGLRAAVTAAAGAEAAAAGLCRCWMNMKRSKLTCVMVPKLCVLQWLLFASRAFDREKSIT
jgi:hypothetical protein